MKIRVLIFTLTLFFPSSLFARDSTDIIVMKNGDRMTCEIKALSAGVLSVKLKYVQGTIGVQWSEVAHLESDQLFLVKTESGTVYTGKLSTGATPGERAVSIEVAVAPEKEVEISQAQLVQLNQTAEGFWQRFNGAVNTGILYSKGNESTQYNIASLVEYRRERWSAQASQNSSLSSSSGASLATRNQEDVSTYEAAALEQLVLFRNRRFPAEFGAGNRFADHSRRRYRAILEEQQPGKSLRPGWVRMAERAI